MKKLIAAILCSLAAARAAEELHPVSFTLAAPEAKSVFVAGDFNKWSTNALPMKRGASGWWVNTRLPAGTYAYKLIKDGQWIFDPSQPAKIFSGQIEVSKLTVPQPFPGFTQPGGKNEPTKPVVPFNAAEFQKASDTYAAANQKFLQSRGDMATLRKLMGELQTCAATFEKYQDSAPRSANCDSLLKRCNKLIFDIHASLQLTH